MNNLHFYTPSHFGNFPKTFSLRRKVPWWDQILDPGSPIVSRWNYIILVTCIIALFLDPLYFYLPVIGAPACMQIDISLGVIVTFFRTVADLCFSMHIVLKFRTAFVAPNSRVFGKGELVRDKRAIAIRYLKSSFVIDLAAALPLPQVSHIVNRINLIIFYIVVESQNLDYEVRKNSSGYNRVNSHCGILNSIMPNIYNYTCFYGKDASYYMSI